MDSTRKTAAAVVVSCALHANDSNTGGKGASDGPHDPKRHPPSGRPLARPSDRLHLGDSRLSLRRSRPGWALGRIYPRRGLVDWIGSCRRTCFLVGVPIRQSTATASATERLGISSCHGWLAPGRRLRFPWMEVERCLLTDHRTGISTGNRRVELYRQYFTKDDWERMRQEIRIRLAPYFDFEVPTALQRRRQHQRAWPLWRKLVDKLVLVGAAMTLSCPILVFAALGRLHDQLNSVVDWLALAASLAPAAVVAVLILRHSRSLGDERWHRRSYGSSAPQ